MREVVIDNYSKAILQVAKDLNLDPDLVEGAVRSQFKLMKQTIAEKKSHFKLKYIGKFILKGTIPMTEKKRKFLIAKYGEEFFSGYKKEDKTNTTDNGGILQQLPQE